MPGSYTPGLVVLGVTTGTGTYVKMTGLEQIPADTMLASGQNPESVAITSFQMAAFTAAMDGNTVTASAGAATLSTIRGVVTSEALVTAAGASYTLTLTNTLVTTTSTIQVSVYSKTNTAAGSLPQVLSVTPGSGSVVIVVKNIGTAALNGNLSIAFNILGLNNG